MPTYGIKTTQFCKQDVPSQYDYTQFALIVQCHWTQNGYWRFINFIYYYCQAFVDFAPTKLFSHIMLEVKIINMQQLHEIVQSCLKF